eukprot:Stramenopile-MAST_4_protein_2900
MAAPTLPYLREALLGDINAPVAKRMRAIYYLRSMGTEEAVGVLIRALLDKRNSPLVRHELAYVLGQIQDKKACDALESIVADGSDDAMVRHESAEALGNIGQARSLALLETFMGDPDSIEVRETCEIAYNFLKWKIEGEKGEKPLTCACMNPYEAVDPTPAEKGESFTILELGKRLGDVSLSLFDRYKSMFALRNTRKVEAAQALGKVLIEDSSSALLRHEIAFVLGQMQLAAGAPSLAESLKREDEHSMVRHEAAEALGAIVGAEESCKIILEQFVDDRDDVVRESCEVALDCQEYWSSFKTSFSD